MSTSIADYYEKARERREAIDRLVGIMETPETDGEVRGKLGDTSYRIWVDDHGRYVYEFNCRGRRSTGATKGATEEMLRSIRDAIVRENGRR